MCSEEQQLAGIWWGKNMYKNKNQKIIATIRKDRPWDHLGQGVKVKMGIEIGIENQEIERR